MNSFSLYKRFILSFVALIVLTITATAQKIQDGIYVIKFAKDPNYVLTLKDDKVSNKNPIHLWKWKNTNSQKWKVQNASDGSIIIRSMVNNQYAMIACDGKMESWVKTVSSVYSGKNYERWIPERQSNGSYVLMSCMNKSFAVDLNTGICENGRAVELYPTHKGFQQQWTLVKVSDNTTNTPKIQDGTYVIKFAKDPNYVLTLKDGKVTNKNPIHLWKWKNDNSQKWKVQNASDGSIIIRSMVNNQYAMVVNGAQMQNETRIVSSAYSGKNDERWIPERQSNGTYVFLACKNESFCLDLHYGRPENDGLVKLYQTHKGFEQQWTLVKVSDNTTSNGSSGSSSSNTNTGSSSSSNNNNKNGSSGSTTTNTNKSTTPKIQDGTYVIKFAKDPNYVLTLKDSKATNKNTIYLWQWKNTNSQKWKVQNASDGSIIIRSMVNNQYAMIACDGKMTNWVKTVSSLYSGKNYERWVPELQSSGSYVLMSCMNKSFAVDLNSGICENGRAVELYSTHKGYQQLWTFVKVSDNTTSNGSSGSSTSNTNSGNSNNNNKNGSSGSTTTNTNTNSGNYSNIPVAPINMTSCRGQNGKTYTFKVTGRSNGLSISSGIHGGLNNLYTDNSEIAIAAVHAGLVSVGQTAVINVTIVTGQASYPSIKRNGITSTDWSSWKFGGYKLSKGDSRNSTSFPLTAVPSTGNLEKYDFPFGGSYLYFKLTGKKTGKFWYQKRGHAFHPNSDLATAAVYSGALKAGETAIVEVFTWSATDLFYDMETYHDIKPTGGYSTDHPHFQITRALKADGTTLRNADWYKKQ